MTRRLMMLFGPAIAALFVLSVAWSSLHAAEPHDHDHAEHPAEDVHDHAEHDSHAGHDHAGHDDHDDHEQGVEHIDEATMREFGIELAQAAAGSLHRELRLPGEVVFNADRIAHVTPAVAGIATAVHCSGGEHVERGHVMATLSSRELAEARSTYLAAHARLALARENRMRDERLFEDKVGNERAVLEARQAERERDIELGLAESSLHAIGYSHEQIEALRTLDDTRFNAYELLSPIDGIVISRHLTIGEVVAPDDDDAPFVVADLSSVWVNLTVYQRDLAQVHAGQAVTLSFGHDIPEATGTIAFVSPALDEATRTATARIVLDNPERNWRPGLFVTGAIHLERTGVQGVVVPRDAVQTVDGRTVVFIRTARGLEPAPVVVGSGDSRHVQIVRGLEVGQTYVSANAFAVKAELNRAALEHAGHAH